MTTRLNTRHVRDGIPSGRTQFGIDYPSDQDGQQRSLADESSQKDGSRLLAGFDGDSAGHVNS